MERDWESAKRKSRAPYIPQAGDQKELEQLDLTEEPEEDR